MKATVLVFSFLVLVLNSIPCCAFDECADEIVLEQNKHQDDPCDNCSPFLSCGTCQGFVVQHEIPNNNSFFIEGKRVAFQEQDGAYFEYSSVIWQPPQFI